MNQAHWDRQETASTSPQLLMISTLNVKLYYKALKNPQWHTISIQLWWGWMEKSHCGNPNIWCVQSANRERSRWIVRRRGFNAVLIRKICASFWKGSFKSFTQPPLTPLLQFYCVFLLCQPPQSKSFLAFVVLSGHFCDWLWFKTLSARFLQPFVLTCNN